MLREQHSLSYLLKPDAMESGSSFAHLSFIVSAHGNSPCPAHWLSEFQFGLGRAAAPPRAACGPRPDRCCLLQRVDLHGRRSSSWGAYGGSMTSLASSTTTLHSPARRSTGRQCSGQGWRRISRRMRGPRRGSGSSRDFDAFGVPPRYGNGGRRCVVTRRDILQPAFAVMP